MTVGRRLVRATFLVLVAAALAACGGGGQAKVALVPVASGMQTNLNGFAFPNFPSEMYPDDEFGSSDLVSMFGSGDTVCVGGTADPCELTAEAAAFARMVNQSRATGHCEGLVTLGLTRFNNAEKPDTVELPDEGDVLHGIMRAFATQFIPEVQAEVQKWLGKSLDDKLSALTESIATGKLKYTLGLYVEGGGHALLPYAIEYPAKDQARIMVYDSNWPAKRRWVDVDIAKKTWSFSFSGEDPENDPDMWSGDGAHMDMTSIDTRRGSCPFCGDGSAVSKNTLVVRSENTDWSVDVDGTSVSPADPNAAADDGVVVEPVKGAAGSKRSAYDYVITVPRNNMSGTTTTTSAAGRSLKLTFSGNTSLFAVTPSGIAQISTPGNKSIPVEVTNKSIVSKDPKVKLSLASGNLVATASGPSASLVVGDGGNLAVTVQAANGQVITQDVTPESPAAAVSVDEKSGGVTVLAQSSTGEVVKRDVAPDGTETKSVSATPLNLNSTTYEAPKGLESKALAVLPPPALRNLANPDYKADAAYVPPAKDGKVSTQAAITTTTMPPKAAPVVKKQPLVLLPTQPAHRYGDDPFQLKAPESASNGEITYESSDPKVAKVSPSGRVTVTGVGVTTVTVRQAATDNYDAVEKTFVLTIGRRIPALGEWTIPARTFGDADLKLAAPVSNSTGPIVITSNNPDVLVYNQTTGMLTVKGAGTATLKAQQGATTTDEGASTSVTVTVAKAAPAYSSFTLLDMSATAVGAQSFTIPTSSSPAAFTYASSDTSVATVGATGRITVVGAGTTVISISQPETPNYSAGSVSATLRVERADPNLGNLVIGDRTYGSADFTVTEPTSDSNAVFTWSSSNASVATINSSTGLVHITGVGTTRITAAQAASPRYTAGSVSTTFTVGLGSQSALTVTSTAGEVGTPLPLASTGGNGTGSVSWTLVNAGTAGCSLSGSNLSATGVGACTVRATKAADSRYDSVNSTVSTVTWTSPSVACSATYSVTGSNTVAKFLNTGTCTWTVPAGVTSVEYLVVGGGGGGASGGGGAGGFLTNVGSAAMTVTPGAHLNVTVGAGGAAGTGNSTASNGGDSSFNGITALGGGGGGGGGTNSGRVPLNGGSGGGGGYDLNSITRTTGTAGQGNGGGRTTFGGYGAGAGGGGAGAAGADAPGESYKAGNGGDGLQSSITGTATWYAGGGGGGINANCNCDMPGFGGVGGQGGGGNGSTLGYGAGAYFNGTSGTANSGGGGGGTDPESSIAGAGGSGIVIVRYASQIAWGQASAEMQSFVINAPAGNKIVAVVFASYGTPTGSNGAYVLGACHASNSVTKVNERVLGLSSVTLTQDVSIFGDPCVGVYKRLYVTVAFGT